MDLLQQERLYFLAGFDKSSASASLAFLARIPHRRATALAWRTLLKAWNLKKKSWNYSSCNEQKHVNRVGPNTFFQNMELSLIHLAVTNDKTYLTLSKNLVKLCHYLEVLEVVCQFHSALPLDNRLDWNNWSCQLAGFLDVLLSGLTLPGFLWVHWEQDQLGLVFLQPKFWKKNSWNYIDNMHQI